MNCAILGTGNIGVDLYFKLKKKKENKVSIFNLNANSNSAKYCKKMRLNYHSNGINGVLKNLSNFDIIFDATNSKSNLKHFKILKSKKKILVNLTPSKIGKFYIPYIDNDTDLRSKSFNLITCGGQSSVPVIYEISKKIKGIKYVEIVSAISSRSAGLATRANIDEYLSITSKAVKNYTGVGNVKVMLNINPSEPPKYMSNSIYIEFRRGLKIKEISLIKKLVNKINRKMKVFARGYKAEYVGQINKCTLKIKIKIEGDGDYLPKYAGNLDIITNMATHITKKN